MFNGKLKYFSIFGAVLIFFNGMNPTTICAQTEIIIEGNVLGYQDYKIRPFGTFAIEFGFNPLLMKTTRVLSGGEKPEYIKVLTHSFVEGYVNKNSDLHKKFTFRLLRATKCDEKINSLVGKRVETNKIFTFVSAVEKNSLPLKKKIPCYVGLYE